MTIYETDSNTYLVGLPAPRALVLVLNLFRWWSGGLQGTCHLTGDLTSRKISDIGADIERAEKRLGPGVVSVVQTDLAPYYPPPDMRGDLMWMLNANSIPLRQGRWLVVCPPADALPGHVVVFWDSHGDPVAERGDELHCICGRPVTITATDVLCASGQPVWAVV